MRIRDKFWRGYNSVWGGVKFFACDLEKRSRNIG